MEISQLDGDFIGKFATTKLGFEAAKWHTCAWSVVHNCENFHNLEADLEKFCFGDFATHFAAAKWALKVEKWHMCAWRVVRSCENFRNLALQLAKFFHRMTSFSQLDFLSCEIFASKQNSSIFLLFWFSMASLHFL